jgi:hypothetical protein
MEIGVLRSSAFVWFLSARSTKATIELSWGVPPDPRGYAGLGHRSEGPGVWWVIGLPGGSSPRPRFLASLGALSRVQLHHCCVIDLFGVQVRRTWLWVIGLPGGSSPRPPFSRFARRAVAVQLLHCRVVDLFGVWTGPKGLVVGRPLISLRSGLRMTFVRGLYEACTRCYI